MGRTRVAGNALEDIKVFAELRVPMTERLARVSLNRAACMVKKRPLALIFIGKKQSSHFEVEAVAFGGDIGAVLLLAGEMGVGVGEDFSGAGGEAAGNYV